MKLSRHLKLIWKYKTLFNYRKLDNRARDLRRRRRRRELIRAAGACAYCKATNNLTIDHIIPRAKGGSRNGLYNLQVLCSRCNQCKKDKLPPVDKLPLQSL